MNKTKNYYLIVPIKDVFVKEKEENIIVVDGGMAADIFNKYHIPEEFQKIIFKVPIGALSVPKDTFELVTGEMFYFKTSIIKAILNKDKSDKLKILSHHNEIFTNVSLYRSTKVKEFYKGIIDNDLALNYEKAVYEVLGRNKTNTNNNQFKKILKKEY